MVLLIFLVLILFMAPLLILGLVGATLNRFGLNWGSFLLFLLVSLLGSAINIPIRRITTGKPTVSVRYVYHMGMPYPVPTVENRSSEMLLSINFGGAIMPLILSSYLLLTNTGALTPCLIAIPIVAAVVFIIARPVKGLGIVTPMFIPPLIAAFAGILLGGNYAPVVAYVGGTVGTLLGADLFHMNAVKNLGAASVSIGGAGTFDGVFLTGLLAALLAF
jgi:uncharacterized membrane protein